MSPVTSMVMVWRPGVRFMAVNTTVSSSMDAYVSTWAWKDPSRYTRAIPFWGPRSPIQRTSVPMNEYVAWAPGVDEISADPPLQFRTPAASGVQPAPNVSAGSSTRVPVTGAGAAEATSKASTTTA